MATVTEAGAGGFLEFDGSRRICKIRDMKTKARSPRRTSPDAVTVPATEAAKNFGRLVDRVREERAVVVVERGGIPVARIVPVDAPCSRWPDSRH